MAENKREVNSTNAKEICAYFSKVLSDANRRNKVLHPGGYAFEASDELELIMDNINFKSITKVKLAKLNEWREKFISWPGWDMCMTNIRQKRYREERQHKDVKFNMRASAHSRFKAMSTTVSGDGTMTEFMTDLAIALTGYQEEASKQVSKG